MVQEMIASDCMVTVNFAEVRGYKLPLTVLIHTKNAIIQGLQRCTHLNSLKVEVVSRSEINISAWAETRISSPEIPMLVRRVKKNGMPYGSFIQCACTPSSWRCSASLPSTGTIRTSSARHRPSSASSPPHF
jgi:predicted DNA binding CopG/RHH family protein